MFQGIWQTLAEMVRWVYEAFQLGVCWFLRWMTDIVFAGLDLLLENLPEEFNHTLATAIPVALQWAGVVDAWLPLTPVVALGTTYWTFKVSVGAWRIILRHIPTMG